VSLPRVAIVGRPNVGKSTLFNKLTGSRKAIAEETAGVTRDRVYGRAEWNGVAFEAIDTGGLELDAGAEGGTSGDPVIARQMVEQALRAVKEAEAVIAVVDATEGLTPLDREVLEKLRTTGKPLFVAANKVDSASREELVWEFYETGVETVFPVSAEHGRGVGELLDEVVASLPRSQVGEPAVEEAAPIRVAVVGRPNVGKSSLVNRLLGEERSIVSATPGTTRDAVDTLLERGGKRYLLVDTAGIRRRARSGEKLEKFSVGKALDAVDRADLVVLVIDAIEGVHEQDAKIAGQAESRGRAAVLVLNKWDLAHADGRSLTEAEVSARVRRTIKFMAWAPIVFLSARTGEGVEALLPLIDAAHAEFTRRLPTRELNVWLQETVDAHPPPVSGLGPVKLGFATGGGSRPPAVVLFSNRPDRIHFSYRRHLENTLRAHFGLVGTPVRLVFRKKTGKPKR